jgi:teichuronic acid biosynthesis glycosyltransferase TuaG
VSDGVSVILPVWNREDTVSDAVRSALRQSEPPMEVLVCDDGSTDGTREIVLRLAEEDGRVRWIPGERAGRPAVPRNRGIRLSRGEWIAFLDSDDCWEPGKLAGQLARLKRRGSKAASTNALRIRTNRESLGPLLQWDSDRIRFRDLLRSNLVVCSSAVVHRSLFETVSGFPESETMTAIEDYALWMRVAAVADFEFLDEPLVLYRDAPLESLRGRFAPDFRAQQTLVLGDFLEWSKGRSVPPVLRIRALNLFFRLRLRQARRKIRRALSRPRTAGAP